jgi:hypothetical protein
VAKYPGIMKLIVTFAWATSRATPARKPVSPARAPLDRSRPAIGIFTENEVMFTIRPKRRSIMPSITRCTSSMGVAMLAFTPARMAFRSTSRKSRNGGPPLLFTRMSTCGTASTSACCTSGSDTSPGTAITSEPVACRMRSAARCSAAASRPFTTTVAPAAASCVAQA